MYCAFYMPLINSPYALIAELSGLEGQMRTEPDKPWDWVLCSKASTALRVFGLKPKSLQRF